MVELFIDYQLSNDKVSESSAGKNSCAEKCLQDAYGPEKSGQTLALAPESAEKQTPASLPIKDVPGASLRVDGNQYFIEYRGLNVPTWSQKNPDGSPAKSYVDESGKERINGKLETVKDSSGKVLGADGRPLLDDNGMRRYDESGNPVATKYEASDPAEMKKALAKHSYDPLNDETRAAYNKMIESADKLDRVSMAQGIEANEKFVMSHTTAFLWETAYRQAQKELGSLFSAMSDFRKDLSPVQMDGLQQLWDSARAPADIDKWLAVPENKVYKDALINDPNWTAIRSKFDQYLNKKQELAGKDKELIDKPSLAQNVARMRECNASDQEYGRLLASSVDSRKAYMEKLLNEESVKKYIAAKDEDKPALENDPSVQDAKRVIVDLAKMNPSMDNLSTKRLLGIR